MTKIFKTLAACALLAFLPARAQETEVLRPVYAAYTVEAGSAHVAETYLSPLRYSGWDIALGYERMQAMRFNPDKWIMKLSGHLDYAQTKNNPARNATIDNMELRLSWSMMHRFRFSGGWSVYAGGATSARAGMLYAPRNSNNPVAAKAAWTVDAAAMATYNGKIGRIPFCARYDVSMPLTGIFFSPSYGELYYEIYLGNRSGLVRGAWPGNYFRLDNCLSVDLCFGATALKLGYRFDVASSKASDIVTRNIRHMAIAGVSGEWISLSPNRSAQLEKARVISAIY
ncbi:MAG: DUF3316 domain-containing protein [Muribaculaceae bacterium]|nr:DUF3316 domain-containing protein [Muribaculaceae bacterium]